MLYEPFAIKGSQHFITHGFYKRISFEQTALTVEYEEGTVDGEGTFHPAGTASLTIANTPEKTDDEGNVTPASTEYSDLLAVVDISAIETLIETQLKARLA